MAPPKKRPSAFDKFSSASAAAVSSGFSTVLAMGPQPTATRADSMAGPSSAIAGEGSRNGGDGGWLQDLQSMTNLPAGVDSDEDSDSSTEQGAAKRGKASGAKKKGASANSQRLGKEASGDPSGNVDADRKEQNRVAQREFRQRKQQYIRALEARVELLSSDHDVQVDRLRFALRGLLAENNQLRAIVASFADFVGSQHAGGPLQKAGISRHELEVLIGSSAEKVMTDAWQNWPGATESETLRQLRLEAKLPPEGLPESARLPEHAVANANAAKARAAEKQSETLSVSPAAGPSKDATDADKAKRKRKSSLMAGSKEAAKRAISSSGVSAGPVAQDTSAIVSEPAPISAPGVATSAQVIPSSAMAMPNMSTLGPMTATQSHNIMAPDHTLFHQFAGHGQTTTLQDPSSLMAGLFGCGDIGDQHNNTHLFNDNNLSFDFHFPSDMSGAGGAKDHVALANFASTMPQGPLPLSLQQQQDEPEEVRRVAQLLSRLQHEGEQHGTSQNMQSLTELGRVFRELIMHMAAFRRQPSYHLPRVLQPSEIQQTRPHDPLVDALPYPGIRQTLISQQDSLVIEDVVMSILHFTNLHPGDPMEENNWELLHGFLIAYPQLIDQHTLDISNRWRATRNETALDFDDIAP